VYTAEDTKYPVKFFTPPLMGLIRHGEWKCSCYDYIYDYCEDGMNMKAMDMKIVMIIIMTFQKIPWSIPTVACDKLRLHRRRLRNIYWIRICLHMIHLSHTK
jgi:hypothetical protein